MNFTKQIFLFLSLAITISSSLVSANPFSTFSVSETQINQYLSKKGNLKDEIGIPNLFSINYQLQDLTAKVGQTEDKRVEMNGTILGLFKMSTQSFNAKLNLTLDTIPYYDATVGKVYLKQVKILQWSAEPKQYMEQLQTVMPFISNNIANFVGSMPIYTLDETNIRDVLIKKFAKGIKVEKGRLEIETN